MTDQTEYKKDVRKLLQRPSRADCMEELEEHLNMTANLARAMWNASQCEAAFADKRDRDAFEQLAQVLADHATAALYAFYTEAEKGGGGK